MSYTDARYYLIYRRHGLIITHAGMTWEAYHSLLASLASEGVTPIEHGPEVR